MGQEFEFVIEISADGETVSGTVEGVAGKSCGGVAALLDKVGEELEHRSTADYDRPEPVRIGTSTGTKVRLGGWGS
jgi:hypothetical protein